MVTDYISRDKLTAEGFVHVSDVDAVMRAAFGTVPNMIDRRMSVPEIARWLQVSIARLRRYVVDHDRAGVSVLDRDSCLSIRQITRMDWSKLVDRRRTTRISGSNFQGRKRKCQKTTKL